MYYNYNFFSVNEPILRPRTGRVLIADPVLKSDFFGRSVILLADCNEEEVIGFILNKVIDIPLKDIVENFNSPISEVGVGGPVSPDSLHFIHTLGDIIPNSQHIINSIYWGGDFDVLSQFLAKNKDKESQVRFFIGYSGWSYEQLIDEIHQNTWAVLDLDDNDIMQYNSELWSKAVIELGDNYRLWLNCPDNPQLN